VEIRGKQSSKVDSRRQKCMERKHEKENAKTCSMQTTEEEEKTVN